MSYSRCYRDLFKLTLASGFGLMGYFVGKFENDIFSTTAGVLNKIKDTNILLNNPFLDTLHTSYFINEKAGSGSEIYAPVDGKNTPFSGFPEKNVNEGIVPRNRISEIMKYGFPSLENIRSFDNFVLSYDRRNRVPNWVFEHLTADTVRRNDSVDRNKCNFFEDTSIHPFFRATNSDYKKSGYDRGHLAAAGNHKSSQKTCEQTFVLSNMAPQVGEGFNRGMWNDLEKYVRKLLKKYVNVYVCTGPLYLPRVESDGKSYVKYRVIGTNTVAVPTHFFKIIVMEAANGSLEMESYVMPNAPIEDGTPLHLFQVPVESIERASGLLFFDKIPRKNLKRINGK